MLPHATFATCHMPYAYIRHAAYATPHSPRRYAMIHAVRTCHICHMPHCMPHCYATPHADMHAITPLRAHYCYTPMTRHATCHMPHATSAIIATLPHFITAATPHATRHTIHCHMPHAVITPHVTPHYMPPLHAYCHIASFQATQATLPCCHDRHMPLCHMPHATPHAT
jgi:hypothetical protein